MRRGAGRSTPPQAKGKRTRETESRERSPQSQTVDVAWRERQQHETTARREKNGTHKFRPPGATWSSAATRPRRRSGATAKRQIHLRTILARDSRLHRLNPLFQSTICDGARTRIVRHDSTGPRLYRAPLDINISSEARPPCTNVECVHAIDKC